MIVILAVLSAAAIPAMQSMGDTRSAMAAKQLLRDLTFARQRAVATGVNTWVVFDTGAETWTVMSEDATTPGRAGASVLDDPGTGRTFVQSLDSATFDGRRDRVLRL